MLARLCSMLFAIFSPQRCAEQMDTIGSERLWQATGYKTNVSAGVSGAADISCGLCRRLASVGQSSTRAAPRSLAARKAAINYMNAEQSVQQDTAKVLRSVYRYEGAFEFA